MTYLTGELTGFPITTILELADRDNWGICPIMRDVVRGVSEASLDVTASEHAIRLMLDEMQANNVGYENLPGGEPFFDSLSSWSEPLSTYYANYNTVSAQGPYLTGYLTYDTLYISGYYEPDVYKYNPAGTSRAPIQGGKYQYSRMMTTDETLPATGVLIANARTDDVIGKIFVKVVDSAYTGGDALFSIGVPGDHNKYVMEFGGPSSVGIVDIDYNIHTLSGGYLWLKANEDIYMYRTGTPTYSVQPNIGVSIFYDKVLWDQSYGYFTRNDVTESIHRFSFADGIMYNRKNYPAYTAYEKTIKAPSDTSDRIYSAGGRNSDGQTFDKIEMFDSTVTNNSVIRSLLTAPRFGIGTFESDTQVFFAGGSLSGTSSAFDQNGTQEIEIYDFTNGTISSSETMIQCSRYLPGSIEDAAKVNAYIYGGMANGKSDIKTSTDKYVMATDTDSLIGLNMRAMAAMACFKTNVYIYFGPGYATNLAMDNIFIKMNAATLVNYDTLNSPSIVAVASPQSLQSNVEGYVCFGVQDPYVSSYSLLTERYANFMEKFGFANEIFMVMESGTSENLGTSPAGSV